MSWSQHELLSFSTSPSAAPRLFYPEAGLFRLRDGKWPQGNHGQDVPSHQCATLVCLLVVAQGPGRQPRPAFFLCPGLTNYDRRGEAQRPDWTAHVWPEILNGAPKCPSFQRREKKERQASRGTLTPMLLRRPRQESLRIPYLFLPQATLAKKNLPSPTLVLLSLFHFLGRIEVVHSLAIFNSLRLSR